MLNRAYLLFLALVLLVGCTDGTEWRLQLEELERQNRADSLMTNDSLALVLVRWFDRHGSSNEQLRAHYILGRTYADRGEMPQALEAYNDAVDCADTTSADCDFRTLSRVHAQTAQLYYSQLLPDNMIREEQLAMKYAEAANDTMQYLYCYGMLAEGYDMKNLKDSALSTLREVHYLYDKVGAPRLASALCCAMADIYRQKGNYVQAEECMREFETRSGYFDSHGNIVQGKEMYYSFKGLLCLCLSDKEDAEYNFRKLLSVAGNYELTIAAYDGLQQFFAKYHDRDSLVKYDRLSDSLCRIAHSSIEMQKTMQVHAMYDYTRSEQVAFQKSREAERLSGGLIIVGSCCAIIILLSIIVYNYHKNARRLLEARYQSEMELLAQAQADLLTLRSEHAVSKSLLSQKEQQINVLQAATEQYRSKIQVLQGYALSERLQQAPVTQRLHQYLKQAHFQLPSYDDWRDSRILINHEIPAFYGTLNMEDNKLNEFEYDVCVLVRLHFSPANIARLKKCSAPYITQIRKGIYKKIFHKEGRAEELDEYILSIA